MLAQGSCIPTNVGSKLVWELCDRMYPELVETKR
jgi:hypothetical protein